MIFSKSIRVHMLIIKAAAEDIKFQRRPFAPFYSLPITNRSQNGSS